MDQCADCSFVYAAVSLDETVTRLRAVGATYRGLFAGADEESVTRRPDPQTWAPIEYAAHVRDVLLVQRDRVYRALFEDEPEAGTFYPDQRVEKAAYLDDDLAEVLEAIDIAGRMIARDLELRSGDELERTLVYNWPERAARNLRWLAPHTLHETVHHADDIRRGLAPT